MIRGFLLGKFMPPHQGHLHVCEVGRNRVDVLTVLVCSHDAEPLDGHLRAAWMNACLDRPGYRVLHMHRDIPQEPKDHPDFWRIWQEACREHHPEQVDWVFGSETYVHKLAAVLDARPFLVDPDRLVVPVSGTDIRTDPARHWHHVPPPVRPHYQTRVTLLGPESSGKSTMSRHLAEKLGTLAIPEYGRDYDITHKQGSNWSPGDFVEIAAGQRALADAIAGRAGPVVLEDTDLIQTLVWAEALLGQVPAELETLLATTPLASHYLLLGPEMDWVDDGTRYHRRQDQRQWFHDRLRHWLTRLGANWQPVSGLNWEERNRQALAAIGRCGAIGAD